MEGIIKLEIAQKFGQFGAKSKKSGELLGTYDDCTYTWAPGISKRKGTLVTGITTEEEAIFEDKLGYEEGTLKKSSKYWANFKIKVPSAGVILDLSDDLSLLKYKSLMADPVVATSQLDLKNNPYSELVMIREDEKADNESKLRANKIKAFAEVSKLTLSEFRDVYLVWKNASSEDMSISVLKNEIEGFAESNPKHFLDLIEGGDFSEKVLITRLINKGVIEKKGRGLNSPLYFKDVHLGSSVQECMSFLKQSVNNSIWLEIMRASKEDTGYTVTLTDSVAPAPKEKVKTDSEIEIEKLKAQIAKMKQTEVVVDVKTNNEGFSTESDVVEEVSSVVEEKPKAKKGPAKK